MDCLKHKMKFKVNTSKQGQSPWYQWIPESGAGVAVMPTRYGDLKTTLSITIQCYRSFCFCLVANGFSGLLRKGKLNSHSLQMASLSVFDI